ncbi:hypothetical protein [Chromobacterium haemolyticum]|uniref:Uncharacterized protein n=1 Tax=Chromobacterium haemolyticum TaxID=394935 RepID=A0A1W0D8A8_9NEIS|nr:hypothetical protein [Chromobacterium haemolyticum]OQS43188.1 hypothetical protein B0T45_04270 [Chromobacterium haemolyticum]
MASKKAATKPQAQQRQQQDKRWNAAEQACREIMSLLEALEPSLAAQQTSAQYAQMAAVYYKKIRNGRVMSPGDFNLAADVAASARRALQVLAPKLDFSPLPQAADCQRMLTLADGVLAAMSELKAAGRRQP